MITEKRYKTVVGLVVLLFALNLATIGSLLYHTRKSQPAGPSPEEMASAEAGAEGNVEGVADQGARYFRELLDLNPDQTSQFREANRFYNRNSHRITRELEGLRMELVTAMAGASPDTAMVDSICRKIGQHHEELKKQTVRYYLAMRNNCSPAQKEKLDELFFKMVQQSEPQPQERGRRRGHGWDSLSPGRRSP